MNALTSTSIGSLVSTECDFSLSSRPYFYGELSGLSNSSLKDYECDLAALVSFSYPPYSIAPSRFDLSL